MDTRQAHAPHIMQRVHVRYKTYYSCRSRAASVPWRCQFVTIGTGDGSMILCEVPDCWAAASGITPK
jgi:hypothetical protein